MSAGAMIVDPGRRRFTGLILAGLTLALSGCGRKPGRVDPPEDAGPEAALFPHRYPDLRKDPPPTVPPSAAVIPPAPQSTNQAPAVPSPPVAVPAPSPYPKILRPEDMTPNAVLNSTGSWAGSKR